MTSGTAVTDIDGVDFRIGGRLCGNVVVVELGNATVVVVLELEGTLDVVVEPGAPIVVDEYMACSVAAVSTPTATQSETWGQFTPKKMPPPAESGVTGVFADHDHPLAPKLPVE